MTRHPASPVGFVFAASLLTTVPNARAQEDAEPSAPVVVETVHHSAAVDAVLDSDPKSPSELLNATLLLIDLGQPSLAEPLLQKLTEAKLEAKTQAELGREVGSAALLRLAFHPKLGPEARPFAQSLIKAMSQQARDPARLAARVDQLGDADPAIRRAALVDLLEAKTDAVTYCLTELANPDRTHLHAHLRGALREMEPLLIGPLLGAMETTDPRLQSRLLELCGDLQSPAVVPWVVGKAFSAHDPNVRQTAVRSTVKQIGRLPTSGEARQWLEVYRDRYIAGHPPVPLDEENQVEIWRWDLTQSRLTSRRFGASDAGMIFASRLADELASLAPESKTAARFALASRFEAAYLQHGPSTPLRTADPVGFELAAAQGPEAISELLKFALERKYVGAGIGAVEVLGHIGSKTLVVAQGGNPAPLVRACAHADRRLRLAALKTLFRINPEPPFAGSSLVTEALGYFVSTSGAQRVVIADSLRRVGQQEAGMLAGLGYDPVTVRQPSQLLRLARGSADMEMVLVHMTIQEFSPREVLYRLRRDWRTCRLPVGLLATAQNLHRAELLAAEDDLTVAFGQPMQVDDMRRVVTTLMDLVGPEQVSVDERQAQAVESLQWLASLASQPSSPYDFRRQLPAVELALFTPGLGPHASNVLAQKTGLRGQKALLELANQASFDLELRRQAADAFRTSVDRYGIRLTSDELVRQYDVYHASDATDKEARGILSSILETIERSANAKSAAPHDLGTP